MGNLLSVCYPSGVNLTFQYEVEDFLNDSGLPGDVKNRIYIE